MTTCVVCRRPLSDPDSIRAGMGPICAAHQFREDGIAQRTEFADTYDNAIPFGKALVMKRNESAPEASVITNVPHLVVHHSPDGFEFGYGGSGAADLALNVCQLYLNARGYQGQETKCYDGNCWSLAWALHQDFKADFVATVSRRGATIPFEQIEAWFRAHMTADLLTRYAPQPDFEERVL